MAAVDIITSYNTGNWWFPSVHLMVVDLGEKKLLLTSCFSFLRRFLTEKSYSEVVKWPFWLMQKTKIKICSRVSTFTVDQLHSRGEIMAIISACHQVEFNAKWLKCWGLPGTGPVPRRLLHLCEVSLSPEPVTSVKLDRNVTDTPSSIWNIGPFPSCLTVRHTLPLTAGGGGAPSHFWQLVRWLLLLCGFKSTELRAGDTGPGFVSIVGVCVFLSLLINLTHF